MPLFVEFDAGWLVGALMAVAFVCWLYVKLSDDPALRDDPEDDESEYEPRRSTPEDDARRTRL